MLSKVPARRNSRSARSPIQRWTWVCLGAYGFAAACIAQTAGSPQAGASSPAAGGNKTSPAKSANAAALVKAEARPTWAELTPMQRHSLQPLAASWSSISEFQKRKWIAISRDMTKLPAPEQAKLHERMVDWVALTAAERSQARLNFAATKKLSTDEKQAKWQAYQALSEEERKKLAEDAPRKLPGAATAVRPVPKQKLATTPFPSQSTPNAPRIATAPHQVDQNTLLPQVAGPDTTLSPSQSH